MSPDKPGRPTRSPAPRDGSPTPLGPTFEPVGTPLSDRVRDRRQLGYLAAGVVVVIGLAVLLTIAYLATTPPVDLARPQPPAVNTDTDDPAAASGDEAQWPRLSPGDKGRPVRAAQLLLRLQGQDVSITGRYGAATTKAVAGFASDKQLEARALDATMWAQLVSPLGPQSQGVKVRALQVLMKGNDIDVPVNGRFNGRLRGAIRLFQLQNGLPGTGIAGRPTWRSLAADAEPLDRAVATRARPGRGNG